jgi:hypothetical protein
MRFSGLKVAIVSIAIACATSAAVNAQDDDKSYLPPKALQGKAEPPLNKPAQSAVNRTASAQPKRSYAAAAQPQRRRVAAYRRHYGRDRYAYNQPSFFPFFGWFR